MTDIACVILAAGLGTRFGSPKATAELSPGVRFVDAIVRSASAAGASPVIAVVAPGVSLPDGVKGTTNPHGAGEQIESARLGLASLGEHVRGALLWPVDHPFVTAETLRALFAACRETTAPAVVPVYEGRRGHPVYFARAAWPDLFAVREGGARRVLASLGTHVLEVPVDDPGIRADMNTRQDLALWVGASGERAAPQ